MSRAWIGKFAVVTLLAVLSASLAVGQERGRRQGPTGGPGSGGRGPMMGGGFLGVSMGGPAALLMNEQVRNELGITEDQATKLRQAVQDLMSGQREQFQALRDLDPGQRRAKFEELGEKLRKEVDKKLAEVLEESQIKRLKEIELQVAIRTQGLLVLLRPEIVQALGITEKQQEQLRELGEAMAEKMRAAFEDVRDLEPEQRREKMQDAMQKVRQEAQEKVESLLSDEQGETLEKMMGKPVEIDLQQGFRRGLPPGGRQGDRGRGPGGGERRGGRGGNR